ncbi:hypothetical protein [Spirosoma terrae]|uniref:Uncharacterized protein n=1 Tax=Spirosoma terrae TaxID=1968276 RepID=A0A6L9LKL0_9BACT|nr:hypothetical protein [Spirosoma terrae]NDU97199.1 hypothetical protein [Spirosoma terrae]
MIDAIQLDYSMYIEIAGRFIQIGLYVLFVTGCFLLWRFTCRMSWGHDVIGRIVFIILVLNGLLLWKQPHRFTLFLVMLLGPLTFWLFFNVFYFSKYPIPAEVIKELKNPKMPGSSVFIPKLALAKYLLRDSPELYRPWWFSQIFRNVALGAGGLFLLLFGFSESIEGYTWGLQLAAKVRQETTAKTDSTVKTAVKAAVDSTKKTFYAVADTIKQGQEQLSQKVDSTRRESEKRADEVKRGLKRTNARFSRPMPLIFNKPEPVGLPQPVFPLKTDRVNRAWYIPDQGRADPGYPSPIWTRYNSQDYKEPNPLPENPDSLIIAKHFMP